MVTGSYRTSASVIPVPDLSAAHLDAMAGQAAQRSCRGSPASAHTVLTNSNCSDNTYGRKTGEGDGPWVRLGLKCKFKNGALQGRVFYYRSPREELVLTPQMFCSTPFPRLHITEDMALKGCRRTSWDQRENVFILKEPQGTPQTPAQFLINKQ